MRKSGFGKYTKGARVSKDDLDEAFRLGQLAYRAGKPRFPGGDSNVMAMVPSWQNRPEDPENVANMKKGTAIMAKWLDGWDFAHGKTEILF